MKTTASVPIDDCLNRGVHPTGLCHKRAVCLDRDVQKLCFLATWSRCFRAGLAVGKRLIQRELRRNRRSSLTNRPSVRISRIGGECFDVCCHFFSPQKSPQNA